jgi:hypothetical protein
MKKLFYSLALLLACGFTYAHSGGTDAPRLSYEPQNGRLPLPWL